MSTNGRRITHAERLRTRDGYFAPESVIRRIAGSPLVTLLAIGPTVLYQCAHPLIAAAIVDHSTYRDEHWERWLRIFGASYLAEVTMTLYDRYVRRLTIGEKERYYADTTVVARMLGATDAVIPPTLAEYRLFLHERLAGPEMTVTEPARDIARAILDGPLLLRFRPIASVNRLAAAGVLPPRLRREYGLAWTPAHNLALMASAASFRALGVPFALAAGRVPQPRLAARA